MGASASRACALLALAAAPASAKLIPIEKSESYAPVLREIQDIKDYLDFKPTSAASKRR